jgi:hypothetical protein
MKKPDENCQISKQAPSLPVPTNQGIETIPNGSSDSASNKSLGCLITGISRELAAERIVYEAGALLLNGSEAKNEENVTAALDLLLELRTANATEAMLNVQMVGTHEAAVKFLRNAMLEGQAPEGIDANVLRATRLMRLYIEQLAAMAKLKGKTGQQKVTVEHVHVNAGGQAIVGQVTGSQEEERK